MCGRYALYGPIPADAPVWLRGWHERIDLPLAERGRYNIAPTQPAPLVRREGEDTVVAEHRWGLVPAWAKDPRIGNRLINARCETAPVKPAFRAAFRARRCLVPMTGYYEWQATPRGKLPHHIRRADGGWLWCAGLWERWQPDPAQPPRYTYALLTRDAPEPLADIHPRMPVFLEWAECGAWLAGRPEAAAELIRAAGAAPLCAYPVSRAVNSPRHDDPTLIQAS